MRSAALVALLAVMTVPLIGGCGGDASSTPPDASVVPRSGTVAVQALDNRFVDQEIAITAGSIVTWTNDGSNKHDVVPSDGDAYGIDPESFLPDTSYSATFDTPGTYGYYCSLHGTVTRGMTGTVVVVGR